MPARSVKAGLSRTLSPTSLRALSPARERVSDFEGRAGTFRVLRFSARPERSEPAPGRGEGGMRVRLTTFGNRIRIGAS